MNDFSKVTDEELIQMRREAIAAGNTELKLAIRKESDRRSAIQMRAANSLSHNPITGQPRY